MVVLLRRVDEVAKARLERWNLERAYLVGPTSRLGLLLTPQAMAGCQCERLMFATSKQSQFLSRDKSDFGMNSDWRELRCHGLCGFRGLCRGSTHFV